MKHRIRTLILTVALLLGGSSLMAAPAGAINVFSPCSGAAAATAVCQSKNSDSVAKMVQVIIGILSFAIGIVATIMIIIGGIRYVTSNGDASQVKSAKDTILYSVIGLIVALMAYAIVNFVTARFA
jgi:hypothetical protein